jgi:hypothetical protein
LNWTPTVSDEAFAETVVEAETVAPDAGEVIDTVGPPGLPELATPAQPVWSDAKLKTRRNRRISHPAFRSESPREALIMIFLNLLLKSAPVGQTLFILPRGK